METKSLVPILLVAGIVLVVFLLMRKRQAIAAANSVQPGGYAGAVNGVNNVSSSVLTKIPLVGGTLNSLITKPVGRLLNGDYYSLAADSASGGFAEVTHYADPRTWYGEVSSWF